MIRSAVIEDAPALVGLSIQLGYATDEARTRRLLADIIASPDYDVLVYDDGEVIAWVGLMVSHSLTSEPHAALMGLVVDAEHRSRGIGQLMMEAAEEWARTRGLGKLRLRTNLVRADAHRFYERIGYVAVKEQRVYEKSLDC